MQLSTLQHPYEPREHPLAYGIIYGGFNTRRGFCFFKPFPIGLTLYTL